MARELRAALGPGIEFEVGADIQPVYAAEYFTDVRPVGGHDPRQHAVGLTFAIPISGVVSPQGEAIGFRWFEETELPSSGEFGSGKGEVVRSVIARLPQ